MTCVRICATLESERYSAGTTLFVRLLSERIRYIAVGHLPPNGILARGYGGRIVLGESFRPLTEG